MGMRECLRKAKEFLRFRGSEKEYPPSIADCYRYAAVGDMANAAGNADNEALSVRSSEWLWECDELSRMPDCGRQSTDRLRRRRRRLRAIQLKGRGWRQLQE